MTLVVPRKLHGLTEQTRNEKLENIKHRVASICRCYGVPFQNVEFQLSSVITREIGEIPYRQVLIQIRHEYSLDSKFQRALKMII